jgi:hypothetical protein
MDGKPVKEQSWLTSMIKKRDAPPQEHLDGSIVTSGVKKTLAVNGPSIHAKPHNVELHSKNTNVIYGFPEDELGWLSPQTSVVTVSPKPIPPVAACSTVVATAQTSVALVPAVGATAPTSVALVPAVGAADVLLSDPVQPGGGTVLNGLKVRADTVIFNIGSKTNPEEEKEVTQEAAPKNFGSFRTLGVSVAFMYVLLIVVSCVWGYILSYLQQKNYIWIVQGCGVWSIMTTMHYLKVAPPLTLAATLLACLAAFGMIEDQFVETKIETRFNYPVTQKMELIGATLDHSFSILDPAFALRKVTQDCIHNMRSQLCLSELREGQRVVNVTMKALHMTLQDRSVVEPKDVVIQKHTGESMVISFNETVNVPLNFRFPTLPEHDFHQMKLCAIMAMRLKNGIHYFKEYNLWLKADRNAKSWMEWIEEKCMYAGFFDIFVRNQIFFGYWSQIKFILIGLKKLIEFVAPDQLGVERVANWLVASKSIYHPEQYVDMCTIDRCHGFVDLKDDLRMTRAHLSQNAAPVVLDLYVNKSCPQNLNVIDFDMDNCTLLVDKCMEGFRNYGNRYAPLCPEHCRDALFLREQDSIKRNGSVNILIYFNDTQSHKFIGGSQEEQSYTKYGPGKLNKIFKTILDYAVKMTGGVFLACAHGGIYIRMMR